MSVSPPNYQREKLVSASSLHWIHWTIIVFSIAITFGAWYFSKEQLSQKVKNQFLREVDQVIELVKERMALYENALWGGVAFIDANQGKINYKQWLEYANSLHIDKTYPGINGIGVILRIIPSKIRTFLARERRIRPAYKLHPKTSGSEYWPITYVEPSGPNKTAIGLDMVFEKNRYTGIKKARDTGMAQLTGPIILVQDAKKTPGFLFYTPFYKDGAAPASVEERRKKILGVTYAPFIMSKLMLGTLASHKRHVTIKITDTDQLLYNDLEYSKNIKSRYTKILKISIYGRQWEFTIRSNKSFHSAVASSQPGFILLGGIIIDVALLFLFMSLSKANRTALACADAMTIDLTNKSRQLQKSNAELEEFAHITSHDLQEPLRAIASYIHLIEQRYAKDFDKEGLEFIGFVANGAKRLKALISGLHAYSQIGANGTLLGPVNLQEAYEWAVLNLDTSIRDNKVTIHCEPLPCVLADQSLCGQVFLNLISNSIKYRDDIPLVINIKAKKEEDSWRVSVFDNGIGIGEEFHSRIFMIFQRLHSQTKYEGTGIGLSTCKKIIELSHGEIGIQSGVESGSEFWFKLKDAA